MKYVCEYCGKQHQTAQACRACEKKCKAEASVAWACVESINSAIKALKELNIPALIVDYPIIKAEYSCNKRCVYIETDEEPFLGV